MKQRTKRFFFSMVLAAGSIAVMTAPNAQGAGPNENSNGHANGHAVCNAAAATEAVCSAEVANKPSSRRTGTYNTTSVGFGPAQFHGAYNAPTTSGRADMTIAVIVGYDNPNAKADLDLYDSTMGLAAFPSCSSTVTTACF